MHTSATDSPVARIESLGRFLTVEPFGIWLDGLCVTRLSGMRGQQFGSGVAAEVFPLYRPVILDSGRRGVQVWSGLLSIIRGSLAAAGYCVTTVGPVQAPLVRDPQSPGRELTDSGVLDFIARHGYGLIRYVPMRNNILEQLVPARLVTQVAVTFPAARIVVIVRTRDEAKNWQKVLHQFVSGVGLSTGRHLYMRSERVVVATPSSVGTVSIELADQVFLADPLFGVWDDPLLEAECSEPPPPSRGFVVNLLDRLVRTGCARACSDSCHIHSGHHGSRQRDSSNCSASTRSSFPEQVPSSGQCELLGRESLAALLLHLLKAHSR